MPVPHHSVFTGWMPFMPPNQRRQSTEGNKPKSKENLKHQSTLRTVHMCVRVSLCTTVVQNASQNSSDNLLSYHPDDSCCSCVVYWRGEEFEVGRQLPTYNYCLIYKLCNCHYSGYLHGRASIKGATPFESGGKWRKDEVGPPLVVVSALSFLQCLDAVGWMAGRTFCL